jgi:hypothetical protein
MFLRRAAIPDDSLKSMAISSDDVHDNSGSHAENSNRFARVWNRPNESQRKSVMHVLALDVARLFETCAEPRHVVASPFEDEALLRNPITGSADCCASATTGHAAAPPSAAMNARRSRKDSTPSRGRRAYCVAGVRLALCQHWVIRAA